MSTPENGASPNGDGAGKLPLTKRRLPQPWMDRFLRLLAQTGNQTVSASGANVGKTTIRRWRKQSEEFSEAMDEALEIATETAEMVARRRAIQGEPRRTVRTRRITGENGQLLTEEVATEETTYVSDTLLIFLLKAYKPEKYRDNYQVRHTGHDGGPIEIAEVYRKPTAERLKELFELAGELEEQAIVEGQAVELPQPELPPAPDDRNGDGKK